LRQGVLGILEQHGIPRDQVAHVRRREHDHVTSFPSEVAECALGDGRVLRLYCKYSGTDPEEDGHGTTGHGHWGGVRYEAEVYRRLLQGSPAESPRFYGTFRDLVTGQTCLVIEYLDGWWRLNKFPEPQAAMVRAANWLGRFHAGNEGRLAEGSLRFLTRYDADYYRSWARRTVEFARGCRDDSPWLDRLGAWFEDAVDLLLAATPTVIHGEYYAKNILCHEQSILPIDWESAAVAAGEVDLASLIEAWSAEIQAVCRDEYRKARWPAGPPAELDRALEVAQFYFHFRWLGDVAEVIAEERNSWRFEALRDAGERLGVL
jgi:hypothetical protein